MDSITSCGRSRWYRTIPLKSVLLADCDPAFRSRCTGTWAWRVSDCQLTQCSAHWRLGCPQHHHTKSQTVLRILQEGAKFQHFSEPTHHASLCRGPLALHQSVTDQHNSHRTSAVTKCRMANNTMNASQVAWWAGSPRSVPHNASSSDSIRHRWISMRCTPCADPAGSSSPCCAGVHLQHKSIQQTIHQEEMPHQNLMLLVELSLTTSGPVTPASACFQRVLPPSAPAPAARSCGSCRPTQVLLLPSTASPPARRNGSCHPQQCLLPPGATAPAARSSVSCHQARRLLPHGAAAPAAGSSISCRPAEQLLPPDAWVPAAPAQRLLSARRGGSCRQQQRHLPPGAAALAAWRTYRPAKRLLSPGTTTPAVVGGRPAKVCCRGHPTLQELELLLWGHVSVDLLQLKGVHHGGCQVHQTNLGLLCLRNCCDSEHCRFLDTRSFDAPSPPMCPPTGTRILRLAHVCSRLMMNLPVHPPMLRLNLKRFPVGVVPHPPSLPRNRWWSPPTPGSSTEDASTCLESESGPGITLFLQLPVVHGDWHPQTLQTVPCWCPRISAWTRLRKTQTRCCDCSSPGGLPWARSAGCSSQPWKLPRKCKYLRLRLKSLFQLSVQTFATSSKSCDPPSKTMPLPATISGGDTPPLLAPSEGTPTQNHQCLGWHLQVASTLLCRHSDVARNNTRTLALAQWEWSNTHHRFLAMGELPVLAKTSWTLCLREPPRATWWARVRSSQTRWYWSWKPHMTTFNSSTHPWNGLFGLPAQPEVPAPTHKTSRYPLWAVASTSLRNSAVCALHSPTSTCNRTTKSRWRAHRVNVPLFLPNLCNVHTLPAHNHAQALVLPTNVSRPPPPQRSTATSPSEPRKHGSKTYTRSSEWRRTRSSSKSLGTNWTIPDNSFLKRASLDEKQHIAPILLMPHLADSGKLHFLCQKLWHSNLQRPRVLCILSPTSDLDIDHRTGCARRTNTSQHALSQRISWLSHAEMHPKQCRQKWHVCIAVRDTTITRHTTYCMPEPTTCPPTSTNPCHSVHVWTTRQPRGGQLGGGQGQPGGGQLGGGQLGGGHLEEDTWRRRTPRV